MKPIPCIHSSLPVSSTVLFPRATRRILAVAALSFAAAFLTSPELMATPFGETEEQFFKKSVRVVAPFEITKSGNQIVSMMVGGKQVRLLVDSSSQVDAISPAHIQRLSLRPDTSISGNGGAGGTSPLMEPVVCGCGDFQTRIGFAQMDPSAVKPISGSPTIDGVLGTPFLRSRNAILDFSTMTLTFDVNPS